MTCTVAQRSEQLFGDGSIWKHTCTQELPEESIAEYNVNISLLTKLNWIPYNNIVIQIGVNGEKGVDHGTCSD